MDYKKINNILGWLMCGIATFVYVSTIEPTASFWDCGEFIATAYNLEIGHPPGAPLFMLLGRFFTMFASHETAGFAINILSALSSSFTILFLFWSITAVVKKLALKTGTLDKGKTIAIFGSAVVGSLAYTFSDSFWFSATEAEVYAMSSLFTALVFWAILKWDSVSGDKHSTRWMVLIAYLMGLSIGVHLLNLLAIPAMVFLFYFKTRELNVKNFVYAGGFSVLILGIVQFGIIPGTYKLASMFELLFVNSMGMPFHSGLIFYFVLIAALISYALYYTQKNGRAVWNTITLCLAVMLVGYSTYTVILVRSAANPPMDENDPENAFDLMSYLAREQYGSAPFLSGQFFNTPYDAQEPVKEGPLKYFQNKETGKYEPINKGEKNLPNYDKATSGFLPRMWSSQSHHIRDYKAWSGYKGKNVKASNGETIKVPTFGENMKFLFSYQWGHLYWRYFMWNFAGRQTDVQNTSPGDISNGNWMSGIKAIDAARLGNQDKLSKTITNNKGHNKYFLLPLILGLIGLVYQFMKDPKDWLVLGLLFFFTGMMINFYTNPPSPQPRERDYAYVGSFYVFAIWMAVGVYALFEMLSKKAPKTISAVVVSVACLFAVPVLMATQNWDDHDRSDRYTARDFAKNYLNSCAPNAILFTNGDNDTFPLWYVQDVERYRTDVRVVNLSLLNTDWYIEQMRRKAWDADGIPQRLDEKKLRQGTNDFIYFYDRNISGFTDVDEIIKFVQDDSPKSKIAGRDNTPMDYIPTKSFKISVDKEKVIASGAIPKDRVDRIVDNVEWSMAENKSGIYKKDLIILDILAANDWERPVYFAITTGSDAYIGLQPYFQLEGLAYRLVPYKAQSFDRQQGEVHTDIMYDNLMNKFQWGGMDKGDIYMDENNRRMCMNFRNNFARLAGEYVRLGEKEKAIEVLDKCLESIPERNVPYNQFVLAMADLYYQVGEFEKGNKLVISLVDKYEDDLKYYLSLRGKHKKSVTQEMQLAKGILQQLIMMTNDQYKDTGLDQTMKDRFIGINSLLLTAS
jgi:Protein O-mannosyl-transferase TMEM260-like